MGGVAVGMLLWLQPVMCLRNVFCLYELTGLWCLLSKKISSTTVPKLLLSDVPPHPNHMYPYQVPLY